jgi:hypothetical protein
VSDRRGDRPAAPHADSSLGGAGRLALVSAVTATWVVVLGFYALAGTASQSLGGEESAAPTVAAVTALIVAGVGVAAARAARRRRWRDAGVLALLVGLCGGAGFAGVGAASGSRPAGLAAVGLSVAAVALLVSWPR